MSLSHSRATSPGSAYGRPLRWIALLLASLLLHLIGLEWATGHLGMPSWRDREAPVMMTELLPPPVTKTIVPLQPKAAAKPKPRPKRKPAPPPSAPPAAEAAEPAPVPAVADVPVESTAANPPAEPVAETPPPAATPEAQHKFSAPPSAELAYDVTALREGQKWYGSGKFQWTSTPDSYRVTGEASITFFFKITVLNFSSEGTIADFGIAPVLYTEKPFRKAMTNTHFQHDNHKISFSASEASYPYNGGEQDRASVIWQLAGIGRGDPAQFAPGAGIDIFVAGTRDAEQWHIAVIGQEEIETPYGKTGAWHVVRTPRPGSYDQKIDIWLSPQHDWYPVKILYTYPNGDYLDMSLSDLTPPAAPANNN
jgi:hypothetical protein